MIGNLLLEIIELQRIIAVKIVKNEPLDSSVVAQFSKVTKMVMDIFLEQSTTSQ